MKIKYKNMLAKKYALVALFFSFIIITLSSCLKDDEGTPKFSNGVPTITKVYLLDTIARYKDSSIVGAEPYKLLVINGENLGNTKTVFFNEYKTDFNPTYTTDKSLIIRVPAQAPTDKTATNKLRVVTSGGEATFTFKIIAKAAVYSRDKYTFGVDRGDILLEGKNFEDVSSVMFSGTKTEVQIVSKTKDKAGNETMTLRFPTTNLSTVKLDITNSSGTYKAADEYINADQALVIFADSIAKDFSNNSWGDPLIVNSDQKFAGKNSISKSYAGGNWHLAGFANWWPSVAYNADYKFVVFAIRGGNVNFPLWLSTDASKIGFGNFEDKNKVETVANTWNFYKLAIKDIDFWYPGTIMKQLGWRVKGPNKTETLYFDDIMLVK